MATPLLEGAVPPPARVAEAASAASERAIARVLAAERDARAAVVECARQAELDLQAARERARVIATRAAARVARVQRFAERELERLAARVAAEHAALAQAPVRAQDSAARAARAIDLLVDELTRGVLAAARAPGDGDHGAPR